MPAQQATGTEIRQTRIVPEANHSLSPKPGLIPVTVMSRHTTPIICPLYPALTCSKSGPAMTRRKKPSTVPCSAERKKVADRSFNFSKQPI